MRAIRLELDHLVVHRVRHEQRLRPAPHPHRERGALLQRDRRCVCMIDGALNRRTLGWRPASASSAKISRAGALMTRSTLTVSPCTGPLSDLEGHHSPAALGDFDAARDGPNALVLACRSRTPRRPRLVWLVLIDGCGAQSHPAQHRRLVRSGGSAQREDHVQQRGRQHRPQLRDRPAPIDHLEHPSQRRSAKANAAEAVRSGWAPARRAAVHAEMAGAARQGRRRARSRAAGDSDDGAGPPARIGGGS